MPHNDTLNLSDQVLTTINRTSGMSFLTDATIASADTKQGLKDAINAVKVHNDQENWKIMLTRALDFDSSITDANILSLTTVAGLVNLLGLPANSSIEVLE